MNVQESPPETTESIVLCPVKRYRGDVSRLHVQMCEPRRYTDPRIDTFSCKIGCHGMEGGHPGVSPGAQIQIYIQIPIAPPLTGISPVSSIPSREGSSFVGR